MHIKIHTEGIAGSSLRKEGQEAAALFSGLLELDGEIYDRVSDIQINFGEEFATVVVTFLPGDIEVVNHTKDSWPKLIQEAEGREQRAVARRSDGRVIAVYVSPNPNT